MNPDDEKKETPPEGGEGEKKPDPPKDEDKGGDDAEALKKELEQTKKERDEALANLTDSEKRRAEQSENFKRLRDMTKEEKAQLSAREIEFIKRQEKLEDDIKTFHDSQRQTYLDDALDELAGDDKELREKIKFNYEKKVAGEANTKQEIIEKAVNAYNMLGLNRPNPLTRALNAGGRAADEGKNKDYTDTAEGKELAGALGVNIGDKK